MQEVVSIHTSISDERARLLRTLAQLSGEEGASAAAMAEALGAKPMSVATTLSHLRDEGYVRRSPARYKALWCLTARGRRELGLEALPAPRPSAA